MGKPLEVLIIFFDDFYDVGFMGRYSGDAQAGRGDSTSIVSPMFKFKEVHFQGFLHSTSLHTIVSESSYTDLGYFRSFIGIFHLTFDASSSSSSVYLVYYSRT